MMTKILEFTLSDWAYLLSLTIAHSLWQGALIGLAGLAVLRFGRRKTAFWRYVASLSHLFAFGAAGLITLIVLIVQMPEPGALNGSASVNDLSALAALFNQHQALTPTWETAVQAFFAEYASVISYAWLTGVFLLSLRFCFGFAYTKALKSFYAHPVSEELYQQLDRIVRRMDINRRVRIMESALVKVPVVIGHLKPVILMPMCMVTMLSTEEIESILAHELAHVRRHDYLINLAQSVLEIVLFYHPITWWLSAVVRREREYAADDLAVSITGNSTAYARALTNLAELQLNQNMHVIAPGFGGEKNSLFFRIKRLVSTKTENNMKTTYFNSRMTSTAAALLFLAVSGIIFLTSVENKVFAQEKEKELKERKETEAAASKSKKETVKIKESSEGEGGTNVWHYKTSAAEGDTTSKKMKVFFHEAEEGDSKKSFKVIYSDGTEVENLEKSESEIIRIISDLEEGDVKLLDGSISGERFKVIHLNDEDSYFTNGNIRVETDEEGTTRIFKKNENGEEELIKEIKIPTFQEGENMIFFNGDGGENGNIVIDIDENIHHSFFSGEDGENSPKIKVITETIHIDCGEEGTSTDVIKFDSSSETEFDFEDSNPLVFINGKKSTKEELKKTDKKSIKSINILKGDKAVEKYGEEAKDGVVLITTGKKSKKVKAKAKDGFKYKVKTTGGGDFLLVVDGKVRKNKNFDDISPKRIAKVEVIKGEKATEKYGKKAKNGVIEITTKDGVQETMSADIETPELSVFPNPTNGIATVAFSLPSKSKVEAQVFSTDGRMIEKLVSNTFEAGRHTVKWNSEGQAPGVYIIKANIGDQEIQRKVVVE